MWMCSWPETGWVAMSAGQLERELESPTEIKVERLLGDWGVGS
jgi:hypothetical protein